MFRTATAVLLLSTTPVFADVIEAQSAVTEAVVYPSGATVLRSVPFEATEGQHSIVVDDLPLHLDAASLRVTGAGDVGFRIVSVDHRITRLPPQDPRLSAAWQALQAEIDGLEQEIEAITSSRRVLETQVAVADGRLRMVDALMMREPQDMVDDVAGGGDPADWAATIEVLAAQMDIALQAKLVAEEEMRPLDQEIAELRTDIARLRQEQVATQLPAQDRSVATVEVVLDQPVSGALALEYRVQGAGWEPVYDVRLEQGASAELAIERHARIWQHTGEAWDDVALTLSTARPSQRMAAPELGEQIAVLWEQDVRRFEDHSMSETAPASEAALGVADVLSDMDGVAASPPVVAGFVETQTEMRGQTVMYILPGAVDVDGDGTVRQTMIDAGVSVAHPSVRSAPRVDPQAYLYAELSNDFGGPILPGRASVYVDGGFVGAAMMPIVADGDAVELPFGSVDGVLMQAAVLDRETGDYGVFSTTQTRSELYLLSAQSVLPYPVELTIVDRAPVSESEDLTIEVITSRTPTEQDVNGQRGVVSWTMELPAGSAVEVEFGYEIEWPGETELVVN